MNIVFFVSFSYDVGTGHIYRCINLAKSIKREKIYFITDTFDKNINSKIKKFNFNIKIIKKNLPDYKKKIINYLKKIKIIDLLVIDDYKLTISYEKELNKYAKKTLVIDDLYKSHYCDYLLNYNVKKYPKKFLKKKNSYLLNNQKYTILDSKYENLKETKKKTKKRNVFIFFGGTDKKKLTLKTLQFLSKKIFLNYKFFVVIGIFNKDKIKIIKIAKQFTNIKIFYNLKSLSDLLSKSEFAIISGGTVLLEALAMKLNILVLNQSKKQSLNSTYYKKKKYLSLIDPNKLNFKLLENFFKSKKIIVKSPLDFKGSRRVNKIILN